MVLLWESAATSYDSLHEFHALQAYLKRDYLIWAYLEIILVLTLENTDHMHKLQSVI